MKAFAVISVGAALVAAARAGLPGTTSFGLTPGAHQVFTKTPLKLAGVSGPSLISGRGILVAGEAPAALVATGAAPATVGFASGAAALVGGPVVAAAVGAAAGPPRVHEVHTRNSRQVIRIEEFNQPAQVVRVHEAPRAPPEILKVQAPAEPQGLIRVVARSSGPARVERVVHQAPGAQVVDVQKPSSAPARVVQVVRGSSPAPRVEFVQEPESPVNVYVSSAPDAAVGAVVGGAGVVGVAGPVVGGVAGPVVGVAGPVVRAVAGPVAVVAEPVVGGSRFVLGNAVAPIVGSVAVPAAAVSGFGGFSVGLASTHGASYAAKLSTLPAAVTSPVLSYSATPVAYTASHGYAVPSVSLAAPTGAAVVGLKVNEKVVPAHTALLKKVH